MDSNEKIVAEFVELEKKLGDLPFGKALPLYRGCWWSLAEKYGMTGQEVFKVWMDWKRTKSEYL